MTATDSAGLSVSTTFELEVLNTNDAPVIYLIGDRSTTVGTSLTVDVAYEDVDLGDTHAANAVSANPESVTAEMVMTDDGRMQLELTPIDDFEGDVEITVTITDDAEVPASASETFVLTVTNNNEAPILSFIPDQVTREDEALEVTITYRDADGDDSHELTVTSVNEDWVTVEGDGQLSGSTRRLIPAEGFVGSVRINVVVTDNGRPILSIARVFS